MPEAPAPTKAEGQSFSGARVEGGGPKLDVTGNGTASTNSEVSANLSSALTGGAKPEQVLNKLAQGSPGEKPTISDEASKFLNDPRPVDSAKFAEPSHEDRMSGQVVQEINVPGVTIGRTDSQPDSYVTPHQEVVAPVTPAKDQAIAEPYAVPPQAAEAPSIPAKNQATATSYAIPEQFKNAPDRETSAAEAGGEKPREANDENAVAQTEVKGEKIKSAEILATEARNKQLIEIGAQLANLGIDVNSEVGQDILGQISENAVPLERVTETISAVSELGKAMDALGIPDAGRLAMADAFRSIAAALETQVTEAADSKDPAKAEDVKQKNILLRIVKALGRAIATVAAVGVGAVGGGVIGMVKGGSTALSKH